MTVLGYLEAVGVVWLAACLVCVVWFACLDSQEQRRVDDHRVLIAHDWPTPDLDRQAER